MTELRGEQFHESSELGFTFGVMTTGQLVKQFHDQLFRQDEKVNMLAMELDVLRTLCVEGAPSGTWRALRSLKDVYIDAFEVFSGGESVRQNYDELIAEANSAPAEEVAAYLDAVNDCIANHPHIIRTGVGTTGPCIVSFSSQWRTYSEQHLPKEIPVDLFAHFSDGSVEPFIPGRDVYIDTNGLPEYARAALLHYRYMYYLYDEDELPEEGDV